MMMMMMVVVVIWHYMVSFPSWYKEPRFATDAAILVEKNKMSALWRHSMGQGAGGTQYM
jgi:hypothetical protein